MRNLFFYVSLSSAIACGNNNKETKIFQVSRASPYLDRHFFVPANEAESALLKNKINLVKTRFLDSLNADFELRKQAEHLRNAGDIIAADKLTKQSNQHSVDFIAFVAELRQAHSAPNPLDRCRQELNIRFAPGLDLTEMELYKLQRCSLLRKANSQGTKQALILAFIEAERLATRYGNSYMMFASPGFFDLYFGPDCAESELAFQKIHAL